MRRIVIVLYLFFVALLLFSNTVETPKWFCEVVTAKRARMNEKTTQEFIDELWETISSICEKYEMDPVFIAAVISVESNFTNVKGAGGVLGMMQILPSTAQIISRLLSLEKPADWNQLLTDYKLNITYGTAYLSYLFKKTGSLASALESYNNGKNKKTYSLTIMTQYEAYKSKHETELASMKTASNSVATATTPESTSTGVLASANTGQTKIYNISPLFAVETTVEPSCTSIDP